MDLGQVVLCCFWALNVVNSSYFPEMNNKIKGAHKIGSENQKNIEEKAIPKSDNGVERKRRSIVQAGGNDIESILKEIEAATVKATTKESKVVTGRSDVEHRTSDFANLIGHQTFVDKTGIIKVLVKAGSVYYVQAPIGFGKTSVISMLQHFFQVPMDPMGNALIPKSATRPYTLFSKALKYVGKNLEVFKDSVFFEKHFGKNPVVALDFGNIDLRDEANLKRSLKELIRQINSQHAYLAVTEKVDKSKKQKLRDFYLDSSSSEEDKIPLEVEQIQDWVETLNSALFDHYGEKVVVLIDNFDAPVNRFLTDANGTMTLETARLLGNFVDTLLKSHLEFAFVVGTTRYSSVYSLETEIQQKSIFSDKTFAPYFGLNEVEVYDLAGRFDLKTNFSEIKNWYHGYHSKGYRSDLYCTTSIVKYLDTKVFDRYWVNTGILTKLRKVFSLKLLGRDVWKTLLSNALTYKPVRKRSITMKGLSELRRLILHGKSHGEELSEKDRNLLLHYMVENGIFTVSWTDKNCMVCPNQEIGEALIDTIYWVEREDPKVANSMQKYADALSTLYPTNTSCQIFVDRLVDLLKQDANPGDQPGYAAMLFSPTSVCEGKLFLEAPTKDQTMKANGMVFLKTPNNPKVFNGFVVETKFCAGSSAMQALQEIIRKSFTPVPEKDRPSKMDVKTVQSYVQRTISFTLIGLHANADMSVSASILFDRFNSTTAAFNVTSQQVNPKNSSVIWRAEDAI